MSPPSSHQNSRRTVGKQPVTPARPRAAPAATLARSTAVKPGAGQQLAPNGPGLALPHERDETSRATADAVDPVIAQAKRDIDAGLVDTDMRATAGLDAELRAKLVPGPGGKAPGTGG